MPNNAPGERNTRGEIELSVQDLLEDLPRLRKRLSYWRSCACGKKKHYLLLLLPTTKEPSILHNMNPEFVKAEFEAIVIELKEQDQRIKELEETVKELSEAFNSLSIAVATGIKY